MRRLVLTGILILSFIVVPQPAWAGSSASGAAQGPWRVVESSSTTLLVDVSIEQEDEPTTALLAIPPAGNPTIQVLSLQSEPTPEQGVKEQVLASERSEIVRLQPLGTLRTVRLARLNVRPFFKGDDGALHRVRRVRVRVRFPRTAKNSRAPAEPDVDRMVRDVVLNPDYPTSWRLSRQAVDISDIPDNPPAHRADALRLRVSGTGIYVVRRDDVTSAGWNVEAIDPRDVHLWLNGQEVPFWFTGQRDGRWDANDEIRFYVPPFRSRYTNEQVWWLTVETTRGRRWQAVSSAPPGDVPIRVATATHVTEYDRVYDSNATDAHGEHWFWYDLKFADFPPYAPLDFPFQVPKPAEIARAQVKLHLYAYKGSRHDLTFKLNGVPAGELHSSWQGPRTVSFSLPDGLVRDGQNTLTIQSADQGQYPDGVYVDSIEVTYRRDLRAPDGRLTFVGQEGDNTYQVSELPPEYALVLDVTDPLSPTLVYGGRSWMWSETPLTQALAFRAMGGPGVTYHVQSRSTWATPTIETNHPSELHTPDTGADVIAIAPRAWHDTLAPWVQWRTQQGYTVKVVALQDIYDEFSYGQVDPEAIRRFARQAYAAWPNPAPRYLLLVGDGSYDFKDNLGFHPNNIIPPYLANVDPWLGETAADIRYGEVHGDDLIPDLFVGRWPVGNREELETVIRKTVFYERDMPLASWQRRIVFVADNYLSSRGVPDSAGDFAAQAGYTLDNQLPPQYLREPIYFMPWKGTRTNGISDVGEMRSKIVLTWNQGAGIMNWVGHASYEQWGEENFLHARHLTELQNADRLPFLFSITCFTGYFHHPEYPSLDEALLLKPDGGTVASWSPTGLAVAYGHQYLQQGFYAALVNGERNIGRLTLAGQLFLLSQASQYSFLPQTYVIIGDPTLSLQLGPVDHAQFTPYVVGAGR